MLFFIRWDGRSHAARTGAAFQFFASASRAGCWTAFHGVGPQAVPVARVGIELLSREQILDRVGAEAEQKHRDDAADEVELD